MGKKPKQVYRSKEEIISELKKNEEFKKKIKFSRETFYPALCKASTNIEDAQMLLAGFNTVIMQTFLGLMKDKKLGELDLQSKLDSTNPKHTEQIALLNLFEDMTIFEAKDHIESMKSEIGLFLSDEQRERSLESLKTKWIDEL